MIFYTFFFSKSFMVFAIIFRPLIHSSLFYIWCKVRVQLYSIACSYLAVSKFLFILSILYFLSTKVTIYIFNSRERRESSMQFWTPELPKQQNFSPAASNLFHLKYNSDTRGTYGPTFIFLIITDFLPIFKVLLVFLLYLQILIK